MSTTATARSSALQSELVALRATVQSAAGNPFIPAEARRAIAQACGVIELLAGELVELRQAVAALCGRDLVEA